MCLLITRGYLWIKHRFFSLRIFCVFSSHLLRVFCGKCAKIHGMMIVLKFRRGKTTEAGCDRCLFWIHEPTNYMGGFYYAMLQVITAARLLPKAAPGTWSRALYGPIAQLVEHPAYIRSVAGPSPAGPTIIYSFAFARLFISIGRLAHNVHNIGVWATWRSFRSIHSRKDMVHNDGL